MRKALVSLIAALIIVAAYNYFKFSSGLGDNRERLIVYTYSAFAARWGPGPTINKAFEEACNCRVEMIDVGGAGLLLQRMSLPGKKKQVDVVMGLDNFSRVEAEKMSGWRELDLKTINWHPALPTQIDAQGSFIPFNWAPMAFVYRKSGLEPPQQIEDLLKPQFNKSIALQHPRTSTTGLHFLYWLVSVLGEEKAFEFLESLKPQIHSISPGWTTAYGMFKQKQARTVFSYLTSPVFHWLDEKDFDFQAAVFSRPMPYQIEFMAIPDSCANCELAERYLRFSLRPFAQNLIMQKNFMYPAIDGVVQETKFAELPDVTLAEYNSDLLMRKEELLKKWDAIFQ